MARPKTKPGFAVGVWYIITMYQIAHGGVAYKTACEKVSIRKPGSKDLYSPEMVERLYKQGRDADKPDLFPYPIPPEERTYDGGIHYCTLPSLEWWGAPALEMQVQVARQGNPLDPANRRRMMRSADQRLRRWCNEHGYPFTPLEK